jgi:hypothetical protein
VIGSSVMCGFFGSYFLFLFGSVVFAILGAACVEAIMNVMCMGGRTKRKNVDIEKRKKKMV